MAIPSDETELLGEKTVQDLCENLSIEGDNVKGTLNYIENWTEFSKTDNSGNFLPLYFEEAKGQPKGTVKVELKGTGAKLKKPVAVDEKDGLIVIQVHDKDNTLEITSEGKETRTLNLKNVTLIQDITKVVTVRDGSLATYNKHISDLQEDVTLGKDAKFTGKLKYVEDYQNGTGTTEGNWLAIHINKDTLPSENVKVGFEGNLLEPDKNDWNYNFRIDEERKAKPLQIEVDEKVLYELDLTGLTLATKEN